MLYHVLINCFLFVLLTRAQDCNVEFFDKVPVKYKTLDSKESVINLEKCPVSPAKFPIFTNEINCDGNNIGELPAFSVKDLPYLKEIRFEDNHIKYIRPKAFWNLTSLTWLNLKYNDIEIVQRDSFTNIKSLQSLNLARNLIKDIENGAFKDLRNLSNVDLSYNELTIWNPDWFSGTALWSLNAGGNKIRSLPRAAFIDHKRLSSLDFSHNEMITIDPSAFLGLNNLHSLYLDNNKIEEFHPDTFSMFNGTLIANPGDRRKIITSIDRHMHATFSGIHTLYIDNNRFTYLPRKMLNDLHKTSNINFHSNPLECACYKEIWRWIMKGKTRKSVDIFKRSCIRKSNPVCVVSAKNTQVCLEEIDRDVQIVYYRNYRSPNEATYFDDDVTCF